MRLAVLASHPIQYQAPLFRELARHVDLEVLFAHRASPADQARAGFGVGFDWDVDLLSGYPNSFLPNVARTPGLHHFAGCDTPGIGARLHAGRFDALLVMGWHLKCFLQGIWAARRSGIPVMVRGDSHLDTPRGHVKRLGKLVIYPAALRMFDAALYVGQRSRQYWRHYGYPRGRLFFSPHCVDNAWFAARATPAARVALRFRNGIPAHAKVALFAGKLIGPKRPLDLVAAARRLADSGEEIVILYAGWGPLAEAVAAATARSGVKAVHLGFCNQSRMPAVYAASDVLVLPSEDETWGLVANEALACGRPIVVSDACGCAPDLAANGHAGRIFRTGDADDLSRALAAVRRCPPKPEQMAALLPRFSVEAAADGVCEALDAIAPARRAAAR